MYRRYTVSYYLIKDNETLKFDSKSAACKFLGVSRCTVSCCYRRKCKCKGYDVIRGEGTTHNSTKTRLYKIWSGMHERCYREKHPHYKDYGGRGITICEEWNDFSRFKEWAGQGGYSDTLTLDRIDNNGNYEPYNCRWVTMKEQQNNKRNNHIIEYKGERYTLTQLAEKVGIGKTTLRERLKMGWSVEDAVEKPVRLRTKGYRPSGARMFPTQMSER
jgi:hypothetical protein